MNTLTDLQQKFLKGSYVRSINYHNTPVVRVREYEKQLAFYSQYFCGVSEEDLALFLTTGRWHKDKPGLIHAFYNGYRNNYDVMKAPLENYGFIGWFFIPTAFASLKEKQLEFAEKHTIKVIANEYTDGRYALNWQEIKDLDKKHVIASHTKTHSPIAEDSVVDIEREILGSQTDFAHYLGHKVSSFAWLSGSPYGVQKKADRYLLEAGYQYLFSNFKIQKLA